VGQTIGFCRLSGCRALKKRRPSGAANSGRSRLQPASGAVQPGGIQAPPLFHEISRAAGPLQQATKGDGPSHEGHEIFAAIEEIEQV
jgi:hypothetical protein